MFNSSVFVQSNETFCKLSHLGICFFDDATKVHVLIHRSLEQNQNGVIIYELQQLNDYFKLPYVETNKSVCNSVRTEV